MVLQKLLRRFVYVEVALAPLVGGLEAGLGLLLAVWGCQVCKVHLNLIELCDVVLLGQLILFCPRISMISGGVARDPVVPLEALLLQVAVSVGPISPLVS